MQEVSLGLKIIHISKFFIVIFLDFLEFTVYTSNNLKTVDNCSTLWKRYVILMSSRHWLQTQEMLKRRKRRLIHPIDGPGAVHSKILSSSSHF